MRDFAAKSGVSHSYIAMLEEGKNSKTGLPMTPGLVTLKKLSVGMDMTIDELIATADDMPVSLQPAPSPVESDLSEGELALIELFRKVPEDQQALVLSMIRAALNNK
jgi:transcriptional regulator with XRE-family HTH domain